MRSKACESRTRRRRASTRTPEDHSRGECVPLITHINLNCWRIWSMIVGTSFRDLAITSASVRVGRAKISSLTRNGMKTPLVTNGALGCRAGAGTVASGGAWNCREPSRLTLQIFTFKTPSPLKSVTGSDHFRPKKQSSADPACAK